MRQGASVSGQQWERSWPYWALPYRAGVAASEVIFASMIIALQSLRSCPNLCPGLSCMQYPIQIRQEASTEQALSTKAYKLQISGKPPNVQVSISKDTPKVDSMGGGREDGSVHSEDELKLSSFQGCVFRSPW